MHKELEKRLVSKGMVWKNKLDKQREAVERAKREVRHSSGYQRTAAVKTLEVESKLLTEMEG